MDSNQAIIEIYKCDLAISLIKENLKLTHEQRLLKLQSVVELAEEMRKAGKMLREQERAKEAENDSLYKLLVTSGARQARLMKLDDQNR